LSKLERIYEFDGHLETQYSFLKNEDENLKDIETLNRYENLNNDVVFLVNKSVPHDPKFLSFDFFIFKPKLLTKNIFIDDLYTFTEITEHYFYNMIIKNNIKYIFVKRFNNDNWEPRRIDDNLRLYHEHDLNKVESLLNYLKV
jgi:hypothetical protein